jgi:hypothetical protein
MIRDHGKLHSTLLPHAMQCRDGNYRHTACLAQATHATLTVGHTEHSRIAAETPETWAEIWGKRSALPDRTLAMEERREARCAETTAPAVLLQSAALQQQLLHLTDGNNDDDVIDTTPGVTTSQRTGAHELPKVAFTRVHAEVQYPSDMGRAAGTAVMASASTAAPPAQKRETASVRRHEDATAAAPPCTPTPALVTPAHTPKLLPPEPSAPPVLPFWPKSASVTDYWPDEAAIQAALAKGGFKRAAYALAEASEPCAYMEGRWRDSITSARASTQTVADDIESCGVFVPPSVRASLIFKGQGTVLPTLSPKKVEWKMLQKDEVSQERRSLVVGKTVLGIF